MGSLTIQPSQVEVNQPVTIKVNVTNVGEQEGTYPLNLTINDVVEETRLIQLPGGNFTVVEFTVIKDAAGTYSVRIGDLTGTVEVVAPSPTEQPRPAEFAVYGLTINPLEAWVNDTAR